MDYLGFDLFSQPLLEQFPLGVIVFNSAGKSVEINSAANEIFHSCTQQIKSLNHTTFVHSLLHLDGTPLTVSQDPISQAFATALTQEKQSYQFCPDNAHTPLWLEITAIPLVEDDTPVTLVACTLSDISTDIQLQNKLTQQQHFTQLVMDNIPQNIFWKDKDSTYLGCNQHFAKVAGYKSTESIVGKTDFDLPWKREEAVFFQRVDKEVMQSGKAQFKIVEPQLQSDGKKAWLETNKVPLRDENNLIVGILGTFEDITDRIVSQKELAQLKVFLGSIIDSMPSVLVGIDGDLKINLWNKGAEERYKVPAHKVEGQLLTHIAPNYLTYMEHIEKSLQDKKIATIAIEGASHAKGALFEEITIYPLQDTLSSGAVIRIDDVTKREQLRTHLNQAQKMDALGQLAGGMAHDFNNILNGITGAVELLRLTPALDTNDIQAYYDLILQSSTRASGLIAKLLQFSKHQETETSPVNVHKQINDALMLLENTLDKRITLTTHLEADSFWINAVESEIQTILINMGINASHAMAQGGSFVIATSNRELSSTFCKESSFDITPGTYISLSLTDTGEGIPKAIVDKIFQPFFTTKEQGKGTGLGLASVYGSIQQFKGAISVDTEVGTGTTFTILFPVHQKSQKAATPTALEEIKQGSGTILLVDDDAILRITGKKLLEKLGYSVLLAPNGAKALEIYRTHANSIDLVVLDMVMPVMNGRECFEKLTAITPDVKVVLASGFSSDDDRDFMLTKGCRGILPKPFSLAQLSTIITQSIA